MLGSNLDRYAGYPDRDFSWYSSVYAGQFRDSKTIHLRPLSTISFPVLRVSVILSLKTIKSVALKTSWNNQPQEFHDGSKDSWVTILVFVSWWTDGYIIMNYEGAFLCYADIEEDRKQFCFTALLKTTRIWDPLNKMQIFVFYGVWTKLHGLRWR